MENICNICPRACKVNRNINVGFCNETNTIKIAKIIKHFYWEEPCLADERGTFAIFFSGCNLKCDYCQNHQISRGGVGKEYTIDEFCKLIEENQKNHDSIDLITPTHFLEPLSVAFKKITKQVPVIWNTNSYETKESVNKESEFVDIFLADLKYSNDELGKNFSNVNDYFSKSSVAIKQMCKNKKDVFENGLLKQGCIIRHLVLPGYVKNSLEVLDFIKQNLDQRIVSLMSQFTPNGKSFLNRKLNKIEYKTVLTHLKKLNIQNGFTQDFESADRCFVPDFI